MFQIALLSSRYRNADLFGMSKMNLMTNGFIGWIKLHSTVINVGLVGERVK